MPAPCATLLLPARERLAGMALPDAAARQLGRADRLPAADPGERAQLLRHFDLVPRGWPVGALTRTQDAGDAATGHWLRADPAYIRPDINGARLLGVGAALGVTQEDIDAFLPALRPLFGDAGFPLDAPHPHRWYLRLPAQSPLPPFAPPSEALGADLLDQLPGLGEGTAPEARRWRALLSEAQVVLHNHPRNAARLAAGLVPVNSLWPWGAGALPARVAAPVGRVYTGDVLLHALARLADVEVHTLPQHHAALSAGPGTDVLLDLRGLRDPADGCDAWLAPALDALASGTWSRVSLDFEDGARLTVARRHRWRLWRRPRVALDG